MTTPRGATHLPELDQAWQTPLHGARIRAVRTAGQRLRDRFASGPRVVAVRTLPLSTVPYPARFAFNGLALSPAPFVTMTHRCTLVQFMQGGEQKSLLFNPTDIDAARATPYFTRLAEQFGERVTALFAKQSDPLE